MKKAIVIAVADPKRCAELIAEYEKQGIEALPVVGDMPDIVAGLVLRKELLATGCYDSVQVIY